MLYEHEDYHTPNRKIHIGLIHSCNIGDEYGILYGFRQQIERSHNAYDSCLFENKIFYFKKDKETHIAKDSLVTYLSYDYDGFTPQIEYVYPVASLVQHKDEYTKMRPDGTNHDDVTWNLINEGKPYIEYEKERNYCVYYPIIYNSRFCSVWRGLWGVGLYMNKEACIYEMYNEINRINYKGWPSLDEVTNEIKRIKTLIESTDISKIIDTYVIKKEGYYKNNPGKDDQYFIHLIHTLESQDEYLLNLLPNKEECIYYDDNAYRSDYDFFGTLIMEEETQQARLKAKSEYTKEKHLAFLISKYFYEILQKKEKTEELHKSIKDEFDLENASKVTKQFHGKMTNELIEKINEYNASTVKGELRTTPCKSEKVQYGNKKQIPQQTHKIIPKLIPNIDLDALNQMTRPKHNKTI